jgi:putative PIN family toxin of toxin-antitoxin system
MAVEFSAFAAECCAPARPVVIDTNIVLDLLVFADAAAQPLKPLLASGALRWIAAPAMRSELERVLGYAQIVPRLAYYGLSVPQVLQAFDAQARTVAPAPRASAVCKDADDQQFIDLAVQHSAILLSKDRAVLSMRKRLLALGAHAAPAIGALA